ncbi:MAG TPA: GtrA family protein [Armatimonadaceae bacterium]|jgi:putative flippase GtrA|nr:GtrA family protein [Armatimonadaceae bacterium]
MAFGPAGDLLKRKGLRQFVKFCIVGLSSFTIDLGILLLLNKVLGLPLVFAATISFLIAVANGFYWNRRWTFRAHGGDPRKQYPKFLLTNIVGWLLNVSIMTLALIAASQLDLTTVKEPPVEIIKLIALGQGKEVFSARAVTAAKICATIVVTAWNFTAARFWTFRKADRPATDKTVGANTV